MHILQIDLWQRRCHRWMSLDGWGNKVFSISGLGKPVTNKMMKLDLYLIPSIKVKSKWNKDLNVSWNSETKKLLEENISCNILDIGLSDDFFKSLIKVKETEASQIKKFMNNKGNHQQNVKTTYQMGENICELYNW